ncbi:putative HTH-type transcriptional regulator YwnA [compost metagenome]
MTILAYHKGELMTSDELASSVRTNPTVVRRLVSKLVEAGMLDSFKGKSGGVKFTKAAKEISLKDIYMVVSGKPLINTSEKEPYKACAVSCSMGKLMDDVAKGLECQSMKYLSSISLSDLASKVTK